MPGRFDVFFSYNTVDHAAVEREARELTGRGLRIFRHLTPGQPWPQALEQTLAACNAVAVFIGADGLGPWQQRSGTWPSTSGKSSVVRAGLVPRLHAAVREHGWEIETIKLGEAPLHAAVGAMAVAEAAAAADWFVYRGQRTPPREPLDA